MLRAEITCTKCRWEGFPDERADWKSADHSDYVSKESICPLCVVSTNNTTHG